MKAIYYLITGTMIFSLLTSCICPERPGYLNKCSPRIYRQCAKYSCTDKRLYTAESRKYCGNYWKTHCTNVCNDTGGADFCGNYCESGPVHDPKRLTI